MQEILVAVITGGLALVGVIITNIAGNRRAGEYMVWTDGSIKRATQDTAYSPADYPPAWEDIETEETQ